MMLPLAALFLAAALPPVNFPFTVDATEDVSSQFPGAPRIQSFSFAQWQGRWVFIGGRIAGYHSVGGGMAEFLKADSNREVWVVDTKVTPAKTYHVPLDSLPPSLAAVKDQWASTAQLYYQDGPKLYIAGGYGQDRAGKWLTFPVVSRVDVPALIEGVMHGNIPAARIAFAKTVLVQSTGGRLIKLSDGYFYLVMGHNFTGSYTAFEGQSEQNTQAASQEYLSEIRKLKIAVSPQGAMSVVLVEKYRDDDEFHRRDLNVTPILSPQGAGLAAYGGVFTPMTQLGYSKPIYLFPGSKPAADSAFSQRMNAYDCPTMLIYDKASQTMYTTFFGGISRHSWDSGSQSFVENPLIGSRVETRYLDGMQWSDQISTIRKVMVAGKSATYEIVHPVPLPAFLGTDGIFIPLPELARADKDTPILDFDQLKRGKTVVGHIFGGIHAYPHRFPYTKTSPQYNAGTTPSKPSDMILKVVVKSTE